MSTNGLNVELAERVILHTLTHPEQHNQSYYYSSSDCGTTACLAGWTVLLGGSVKQINECTRRSCANWATTALQLLDPSNPSTSHIEHAFFETRDTAIKHFCGFFGLDLEALTEKAKAARGELA